MPIKKQEGYFWKNVNFIYNMRINTCIEFDNMFN